MADEERLVVALEARITQFEKNFARATRTSSDSFGKIERRSKVATDKLELNMGSAAAHVAGLGKSMAAGFVGGFLAGGLAGIVGKVDDIAKGIAEIGDAARRAGLGVETFQELKYVAEQNRIGVDSLTDGIKELNLRADEFIVTGGGSAAEAFGRLGYNAETLKTKLKDPSALFTEIIGKLGQLDRAAQIRIADEIFGGNGGEKFVQLIEQGQAALNRTRQEAHDLGLVMDAELIAKADVLDRKFNALANTVGAALKSAIVEAGAALGQFIDQFNDFRDQGTATLEARYNELSGILAQDDPNGIASSMRVQIDPDIRDGYQAEIDQIKGVLTSRAMKQLRTGLASIPDNAPIVPIVPVKTPAKGTASGGGRSAGAMREQQDAAAGLIASLEDELRLLGQSEIEQRVNIELRKAGAGATDAQKTNIRDLVSQIQTETTAMDQLQSAMGTAEGLTKDFMGGLLSDLRSGVDGATALANAFGRLGDKLLDLALNSAIEALFGGLMGGGLFGMKQGGPVHLAGGGAVRGPGTATSDSIPAMLSDGEFVVNAQATGHNRHLLEAINSGRLGHFADGGAVGSVMAPLANDNRFAANDNAPSFHVENHIRVEGSAGTPAQNADLAEQMGKQLEQTMRGIATQEIIRQGRPGNVLNSRSR